MAPRTMPPATARTRLGSRAKRRKSSPQGSSLYAFPGTQQRPNRRKEAQNSLRGKASTDSEPPGTDCRVGDRRSIKARQRKPKEQDKRVSHTAMSRSLSMQG